MIIMRTRLGVLTLLLAGSTQPATQLIVVVDSDLVVGTELAAVVVSADAFPVSRQHRFDVAGGTPLPFSFGLVAPAGHPTATVRVSVTAVRANGESLVGWSAATHFVHGRTLRLDARLARACMAEDTCSGTDQVCDGGMCRPREIDPAGLPDIDGSAPPPRLFDGPTPPPDGGAMPDAPPCVEDQPCPTGDPCVPGARRCVDGACMPTTPLPAGEPCGEGRACDAAGRCGVRTS